MTKPSTTLLQELQEHTSLDLQTDLTEWLPKAIWSRYLSGRRVHQELTYRMPDGVLAISNPIENVAPVYWDGADFVERPYPGHRATWTEYHQWLAEKIVACTTKYSEPVTVVDFGCGNGALGLHITLRDSNIHFVNIDRDADALA